MKKVKILALLTGIVAAILIFVLLSTVINVGSADKVKVVTASQTISANTLITEDMLLVVEVAEDAVLPSALTKMSDAIGKTVKADVYQGEQLISEKVISPGDDNNGTLAYSIDSGMRAITISVDPTSGVAGMIHPADRIDLIGEFDYDGNVYTDMVGENINVLAVDNNMSSTGIVGDGSIIAYSTLTLEVTPSQAMEISMAAHSGALRAILRSPLDNTQLQYKSITLKNVLKLS